MAILFRRAAARSLLTAGALVMSLGEVLAQAPEAAPEPSSGQTTRAQGTGQSGEPSVDELANMDLDALLNVQLVTASRRSERLSEAPGTVIVVTRQQIIERGYTNLLELLEDLPSIDVQRRASETFYNRIAIRGVEAINKFLILQDGVRISSAVGDVYGIGENYPLNYVKQVEVVYGPASALYGADAVTGVINLISLEGSVNETEARAWAGQYGYMAADARTGYKITEDIRLHLSASAHRADNPDLRDLDKSFVLDDLVTFDGMVARPAAERRRYWGRTSSYALQSRLDLTDHLTVGLYHSLFSRPTTAGEHPNNVDYDAKPSWHDRLTAVSLTHRFELAPKVTSELVALYGIHKVDERSKYANIYSNFQNAFKYGRETRLELTHTINWQIVSQLNFIAGYTLQSFDVAAPTPDLPHRFDPDRPATQQGFFYAGTDDMLPIKFIDINYWSAGALAQALYRPTSWLSITAGVRWDHSSLWGDTVNPRANIVLNPTSTTILRLSYGEAFFAPPPSAMFDHYGAFTGERNAEGLYVSEFFHIPNPNGLNPEKARSGEIRVSQRVSNFLTFDVTGYVQRLGDIVGFAATAEPVRDYIPGGDIAFTEVYANGGHLTAYGGDFTTALDQRFGAMGLRLFGNYSYTDGEFSGPTGDSPLPGVARNKIRGGVTWSYGNRYYVTPTADWIARTNRAPVVDGGDPGKSVPGYAIFGLYATAQRVLWGLSLYLKIQNVFNATYYSPGRELSTSRARVPQDPFWIKGGIGYTF